VIFRLLLAVAALAPIAAQAQVNLPGTSAPAKPDCLVIGDSVASGLATALAQQGKRCDVVVTRKATASQLIRMAPLQRYAVAFVAAGSTQPKYPYLEDELRVLRSQIRSGKVVWVLPYDRTAAAAVSRNAGETGGLVVDLAFWPTADGLHPMDYSSLAAMIVK
jgi:hypothetical protein